MFESMGTAMEVTKYKEKLVPSTRFVSVDGIAPAVSGANNFVAPSASIVGNVSIGDHSRYVIVCVETGRLWSFILFLAVLNSDLFFFTVVFGTVPLFEET
jgi:hypothetical protein